MLIARTYSILRYLVAMKLTALMGSGHKTYLGKIVYSIGSNEGNLAPKYSKSPSPKKKLKNYRSDRIFSIILLLFSLHEPSPFPRWLFAPMLFTLTSKLTYDSSWCLSFFAVKICVTFLHLQAPSWGRGQEANGHLLIRSLFEEAFLGSQWMTFKQKQNEDDPNPDGHEQRQLTYYSAWGLPLNCPTFFLFGEGETECAGKILI